MRYFCRNFRKISIFPSHMNHMIDLLMNTDTTRFVVSKTSKWEMWISRWNRWLSSPETMSELVECSGYRAGIFGGWDCPWNGIANRRKRRCHYCWRFERYVIAKISCLFLKKYAINEFHAAFMDCSSVKIFEPYETYFEILFASMVLKKFWKRA